MLKNLYFSIMKPCFYAVLLAIALQLSFYNSNAHTMLVAGDRALVDEETEMVGDDFSFAALKRTVFTTSISSVTHTSAVGGGTVSSTVTNDWITEVGIVWSTSQNPTVALSTKLSTTYTYGTQYYPLTFNGRMMTGLNPSTTYYVRAYARSGAGAGTVEYGPQVSFVTLANPLPVKLNGFAAKAVANGITLNWQTLSEINSSYFELFHGSSKDDFKPLTKISSLGNSSTGKYYSYLHNDAILGDNYYKLVAVDADGIKEDFGVVVASFAIVPENEIVLSPNPTPNKVKVGFSAGRYQKLLLSTVEGKILQQFDLLPTAAEIELDLIAYPKGIYLVKLSGGGHVATTKVVKN